MYWDLKLITFFAGFAPAPAQPGAPTPQPTEDDADGDGLLDADELNQYKTRGKKW